MQKVPPNIWYLSSKVHGAASQKCVIWNFWVTYCVELIHMRNRVETVPALMTPDGKEM
jgi:hypothetical protein